jgi:hypothetical protein
MDVKSNAVRCIQRISSCIREKSVILFAQELSKIIVAKNDKAVQDIYSLAIRSLISEIN